MVCDPLPPKINSKQGRPGMDISVELDQAKDAIRQGDLSKARSILRKVLEQEPRNIDAWLLFAEAAQKPEHTVQCLERVLILDPGNATASARLESLRSVPPLETPTVQENIPAVPVNIPATPLSTPPFPPPQTRVPSTATSRTPAKAKASISKTEKILIAVAGLLSVCFLCALGFTLLRDPLMGMIGSRPTLAPTDYAAIIYENIRASNAEDKQAYMATIHPDSPAYKVTEETLDTIFDNYDLSYRVSNVSVIEENNLEVTLTFTLVTRKIRGQDFRNNQVDGTFILRKDGDMWKIYNQTVDNIKYLD
jgi:hypothetical protein